MKRSSLFAIAAMSGAVLLSILARAGDAEAGPVRIEFSWLPPQSSGS
jgi:hypothetical protein